MPSLTPNPTPNATNDLSPDFAAARERAGRRRRAVTLAFAGVTLVGLITGGIMGWHFGDAGLPSTVGPLPLWTLALVLIGLVATFVGTLVYWNALDELAKRTHEVAFAWGGNLGLGVLLVILATALTGHLPLILPPGADSFLGGGIAAILLVNGGYAIAWTVLWLRKR